MSSYSKPPKKQKPPSKSPAPSTAAAATEGERIQKLLAHAGLGSRRQIEQWISAGKVRVNGVVATLGDRIRIGDALSLNGRPVDLEKRINTPTRVLIYHKPLGEVVTRRDPEGRPVVFTQLPKLKSGRWIAVGRLDINTQGLLLVTTNGELANRLMHPAQEIEREYSVRILGEVDQQVVRALQEGVDLDDGPARFEQIEWGGGQGANKWFRVTLKEGRNRIVRRLWESQGVTVSRLLRVRYGPVALPEKLKARTFYELDFSELAALMQFVGMEPEQGPPEHRRQPLGRRHKK